MSLLLMVQCEGIKRIYNLSRESEKETNIHNYVSLVDNHLKLRTVVFLSHQQRKSLPRCTATFLQ